MDILIKLLKVISPDTAKQSIDKLRNSKTYSNIPKESKVGMKE
jgi:hypothetical protein